MAKTIILICLILLPSWRENSAYYLMGTAQHMDGDCILLTPDEAYSEGLAWHTTKMDLSHPFEIEFEIYLGNKDEGADGIAFVVHNDPRGFDAFGTWGECLGYGRWNADYWGGNFIYPSIAIEFDTYENPRQNDPVFDHIAWLENGTTYHETYWHNDDEAYDLEDDHTHNFRFRWDPDKKEVKVFLDNHMVVHQTRDLVNAIFKGKTQVIWGFTASTGRKFNQQYFCLRKWASNSSFKQGMGQ